MDNNPYAQPTTLGYAPQPTIPLASQGARFVGALVDSIVPIAALFVGLPIMMLDPEFGVEGSEPGPIGMAGAVVSFVSFLTITGLQWYWIASSGQSVGKKLMNIQIRKLDGSPVGFVSGVIMRSWLLSFAIGVLNIISCGLLGSALYLVDSLMILGNERRCLHDLIASTVVIELQPAESFHGPLNAGAEQWS